MTSSDRGSLADRLARRLQETTQPETFSGQAEELREMVLAAIRLLRGEPLGWLWTRLLAESERRERGPHRNLIWGELRYLREHAERAGVWLMDSELVYLAVRNITWDRHTRSQELWELRGAATDTLLATAPSDLIPLLSLANSPRLGRVSRTPVAGLGVEVGVGTRRAGSAMQGPLLSRPSRASRQATDADLAIIRAEMTVHPDGHAVILVPEGDLLRDYALELRSSVGDVTLVAHGAARPSRR